MTRGSRSTREAGALVADRFRVVALWAAIRCQHPLDGCDGKVEFLCRDRQVRSEPDAAAPAAEQKQAFVGAGDRDQVITFLAARQVERT